MCWAAWENAGPAGAEQLGLQGSVDKDVLPVFWRKAAGRSGSKPHAGWQ